MIAVIAAVFVFRRGQDNNWDLLNYHYYSGYSLLHWRFDRDIAAAGLQGFLNPIANVLAYFALTHLAFPESAWLILSVQLLSLPLVALITRRVARDLGSFDFGLTELLALFLSMLAPLWWSELGTSFFSSTTTPFVLLGLYLGLQYLDKARRAWMLFLSGACFGLSVGLKMTNVPFAIGFCVALMFTANRSEILAAIIRLLVFGSGLLIGFLSTAWWNFYLLARWGSPVFPLYNAIFKSPFYELENYQDLRWRFGTVWGFFRYLLESPFGTERTSEISFADPRLLFFFALLIAVTVRRKRQTIDKGATALFYFFVASFAVWAFVFAYQRYLIPLELLFGPLFWIMLSQLNLTKRQVGKIMMGLALVSAALIKVPDWGHAQNSEISSNAFGLRIPKNLVDSPANYLIYGVPNSYILPFFHEDSNFYKIDFSQKTEALIRQRLQGEHQYPTRVLTNEAGVPFILGQLERLGYAPNELGLECWPIESSVDRYLVCEILRRANADLQKDRAVDLNFSAAGLPLSRGLQGVHGMSAPETWGTWSDDDRVVIDLKDCLPVGPLTIRAFGRAFGRNAGKPVDILFGENRTSIVFSDHDGEAIAKVNNTEACLKQILVMVPEKISPRELGIAQDTRALGIGLVYLGIESAK